MQKPIFNSFHRKYAVICLVVAALFCAGMAQADEGDAVTLLDRTGKAFASVARKVAPAVVHIRVEKGIQSPNRLQFHGQNPENFFNNPFLDRFLGPGFRYPGPNGRNSPQYRQSGTGSGFIISDDGYILTNHHVIRDADTITVRLDDKREFAAEVIGSDAKSDVALIRIDAENLPTVPLGDSDKIDVGEWVIAIGSPFELNRSVTVGVVSAKGRNQIGINDYENFIQTDAAINPGNSGGPLLNIHGRVIGINTAIFSRSGGYMGIGFAIPVNMAKNIQQQLMSNGKVTRGWLGVGIQDVDSDLANSFQLESATGILLTEVSQNSPADRAGLQQGDVLLAMDGIELTGVTDLRNRVAMTAPGSKVEFSLSRDGKKDKITVTIGEQPADFGRGQAHLGMTDGSPLKQMGLSLQDLSPELAERFDYKINQGVLIADVRPGSVAAKAGIQPGHLMEEINRQRIHNMGELQKALQNSKSTNQILLRVRNGQYSRYIVLRLQ